MRGCDPLVYAEVTGKFEKAMASACWSMLNYTAFFKPGLNGGYSLFAEKDIWVGRFVEPETAEFVPEVVATINEITPCVLEERVGVLSSEPLIRVRLLKTYDQSLILLNFIRNLWHDPSQMAGYGRTFGQKLREARALYSDPLARLTWANREACQKHPYPYGSPGHSNCHRPKELKVKTARELLDWNGTSTYTFLTSGRDASPDGGVKDGSAAAQPLAFTLETKMRRRVRKVMMAALGLSLLFLCTGCWGFQIKQIVDAASEAQIKQMEAQAKIDKEKRAEKYSVEGTVKTVEMREREVPDKANAKAKETKTEKGVKVEWETPTKKVRYCVVLFADGREKEFDSIPSSPLDGGKYYRIEYNGMNEITGVQRVER